jgi:hypothetical protein
LLSLTLLDSNNIFSTLHYESCKEHITYLQVDELHTSDEGVSNVNPRVRNLVTTRVMLMYYAFSMTFIDV